MKSFPALLGLAGISHAAVDGFDISHYQESVDYAGAYAAGARFVIIKVGQPPAPSTPNRDSVAKPSLGDREHYLPRPLLLHSLQRRY